MPEFIASYNSWFEKKNRQFFKKKEQLEKEVAEERKRQAERLEEIRQKQKEERAKRGPTFTYTPYKATDPVPVLQPPKPILQQPKEEIKPQLTYEERKAEIIDKMNQTENVVLDSTGVKWIKCEVCRKVDEASEFVMYGGAHKRTLGLCAECSLIGNK